MIQHDNTNYSSSFITGRGNPTSVTRWNVEYPTTSSYAVTSSVKYNIAGSPVEQSDALGRAVQISYADNFNDTTTSRDTFAYPTKLTEAANTDTSNNYSLVKYRFDIGANVWAKSPKPAGNNSGKETTGEYDSIGRLLKDKIVNTGAYTRYEYPTNGIQAKIYSTIIDADGDGQLAEDEVLSESWTDGAGRVRKSRTEHPNSTGGYSGALTEYDILGRVKRSSVPTEIDSSWNPDGDDETRGFLWSSQEYDWKGRVTRIIPSDSNGTDGKDQLFSYEGCGCAGGQVTTIQSESVPRDDQPNTNARRTQKIYQDILGRTYKTEVMNWDGTTPYTTTVQTFNGRDQVIKTRQYAGSTSSSTYQDVTMTYDGHGRMKTRHYPIEDANTETTWSYNADDKIQMIIDPRGAITNFTYNSRGLVEQISYAPPDNHPEIPDTPNVNFTYDSLGNRTEMEDGTGTTNYNYNELSQITSESKIFSDRPNDTYTIGYTYNLSGGLKSITDPFGDEVDYTNDKTGRVTAVAGSSWAQNTTGNYAGNIKYRAFGQIKQMDYLMPDDTSEIKLEYDNRLRVNHSEVSSENIASDYLMKADFSYSADGRVQAKDDLLDNKWDRTMKYDFAGRLTFNQFGLEFGTTGERVYEQSIVYDAFSMMTSRIGVHWGNEIGFTATYLNGRKQNSTETYDVAGNIVHAPGDDINSFQTTTFDASGRRTVLLERWHTGGGPQQSFFVFENQTEQVFDGDGRPAIERTGSRRVNQPNPPTLTTGVRAYQVWSTVLGSSLTTVTPGGDKFETSVFAGGALIAKQKRYVENSQNYDSIEWTTADPVTGTVGKFSYSGEGTARFTEETEPLGQKIATGNPNELPQPTYNSFVGSAGDMEWQCQIPQSFYGGFSGMPFHCQKKALYSAGDKLPWEYEQPANPHKVANPPMPDVDVAFSASDEMLNYSLTATAKQQDDKKKCKGKKCKGKGKGGGATTIKAGTVAEVQSLPSSDFEDFIDLSKDPGEVITRKYAYFRRFVESRVTFVGDPNGLVMSNQAGLLARLTWLIASKDCNETFKRELGKTPYDVLKERKLYITDYASLGNPQYSQALGISDEDAQAYLARRDEKRPIATTKVEGLPIGIVTIFNEKEISVYWLWNFWSGNVDESKLDEAIPHEAAHMAEKGEDPFRNPFGRSSTHDLSGWDAYKEVQDNCQIPLK